MVNIVLESILKTSWVVSAVILFILLLRKVMGPRMSTKSRQLIWGIILLRLLLPVGPECPISLMNWIPTPDQFIETIIRQHEYTHTDNSAQTQNIVYAKKGAVPEGNTVDKIFYMQNIFNHHEKNQVIKSSTETKTSSALVTALFFLWSAGCLSFLGISALSIIRFRHINKDLEIKPGLEILKELHYCKKKLQIYQNISLMFLPKLNSPVLTGIYHSKVYLPENLIEQISSDELRYILMHELVHWKRKDILWNLILILALSIHWFNPLVWIASQRIKEDWEMCCDAKVLEIIGKEKAGSYGNAILQIVKFQNRQLKGALYQTAFFANKKQTKRRIIMINKFYNGMTNKFTRLALVLCIILGIATLTDAPSYAEKNTYDYSTPSKFQLYDSIYHFDTLDQFCRYADFSFQLPNYLPTIFQVYDYRINRDGNQSYLTVNYWYNTMDGAMVKTAKEEHFELKISKTNLLKLLAPQLTEAQKQKSNFIASYESIPKVLAGVSGTQLTVMVKDKEGHPSGGDNTYKEDKTQYFIWEKQGVWYAMEYLTQITMEKRSYYLLNLSEDEISHVIHSFTDPDKITHKGYFIKEEMPSFAVYDENDLKRITKEWNFSPNLPMKLPGLKAKSAYMCQTFYGNKEFGVFQITYTADENSSSKVLAEYEQATQPAEYNEVVKLYQEQQKGTLKNNETAYTLQLIKNTKVYCLEEKKDSVQKMHYFWDTGSLSIEGKADEHIKILNAIIN